MRRTQSVSARRRAIAEESYAWQDERRAYHEKRQWMFRAGRVDVARCAWLDLSGRWVTFSPREASLMLDSMYSSDEGHDTYPPHCAALVLREATGTVAR